MEIRALLRWLKDLNKLSPRFLKPFLVNGGNVSGRNSAALERGLLASLAYQLTRTY